MLHIHNKKIYKTTTQLPQYAQIHKKTIWKFTNSSTLDYGLLPLIEFSPSTNSSASKSLGFIHNSHKSTQ